MAAAAVVAVTVLAVPGLGGPRSPIAAESAGQTAEKGPCLLPAPEMRRRHKTLLFEERTLAVRQGLRNPEHSLERCVSCHAVFDDAGQPVPYEDERNFCHACHMRVAVAPDCFSCHRSTPLPRDRAEATP